MLRYLFDTLGFGWAVRISALMTAVLCVVAVLIVKPRRSVSKKARLVPDMRTIKDPRFLLLVLGSFFVCLGAPAFTYYSPKTLF